MSKQNILLNINDKNQKKFFVLNIYSDSSLGDKLVIFIQVKLNIIEMFLTTKNFIVPSKVLFLKEMLLLTGSPLFAPIEAALPH